ncbi:ParB/RepB/Spo0J family partition protein [Leucobacter chromiireducens]|uniref:ParB-like N-terminal domain-containing protein n=1 Tax=Leucobacter chromiireducens subsp. solipictus TaxID=398235 RepID=A0ABS1SE02_9MICO|nr:ParB N-terminal domain-containing protein [Leucobacter chromiireducens]MBL3678562.1 hypothetical protein [Leucobacter chromiireducens subsp. solipictus]
MNTALIPENVTIRSAELDVESIVVLQRQRAVADDHVRLLHASFEQTGKQIVPIAVSERPDGTFVLVDGAHRLEAAKRSGWDTIRVEIYTGLEADQEGILELVTNEARKNLSPAEIHAAWASFDLPYYELRTKERQAAGGLAALKTRGLVAKSPVTPAGSNWDSTPALSVTELAVEKTGHKPEWLAKVATIHDLSQSEKAPRVLREAAERAYEKLKDPKAKVEPVYREVQRIHEAVLDQKKDPDVLKLEGAEKRLDEVVRDTTLFQQRLEGDIREVLHLAASKDPMNREMLRSARVALVHALTALVVVECEVDGARGEALKRVGGEVTTLLHAQAVRQLGLEVRHG